VQSTSQIVTTIICFTDRMPFLLPNQQLKVKKNVYLKTENLVYWYWQQFRKARVILWLRLLVNTEGMKKRSEATQTLHADCSKADPQTLKQTNNQTGAITIHYAA